MELIQTIYVNNYIEKTITTSYINCEDKYPSNINNPLNFSLTGFYCFNSDNILIGGFWDNIFLSLPTFIVKRCDINTEKRLNIKCATDEEIKEKHPGTLYINFYLQDHWIYPQNYNNPVKILHTSDWVQYNLDNKEIYNKELYYNTANVKQMQDLYFKMLMILLILLKLIISEQHMAQLIIYPNIYFL